MPNGTITLSPVANVNPSTAFDISGSLTLTPVVTYKDDGGSTHSVTMGAMTQAISISHPGLASGVHTVTVADSVSGATADVSVTVVAPPDAIFIDGSVGGNFDDNAGNNFRVDNALNAYWTPSGGSETSLGDYDLIGFFAEAMAFYNNVVYIQDSRDDTWHTFDVTNHTFSGSVSAPPGAGGPAAPPPAVFIGANQSFTTSGGDHYRIDGEFNGYFTPSGGSEVQLGTYDDLGFFVRAMADYNSLVYVESSLDGTWHTFNPTAHTFSSAVTPPPGSPSDPPSGDPGEPPINPAGVPPQAAAVGYNTLTFDGSTLTLNTNCYAVWPGVSQGTGHILIEGDSTYHFNDHLGLEKPDGSGDFVGTVFGGGGYFEARLSFDNSPEGWFEGADGWPSFWFNAAEAEGYSSLSALTNDQNLEVDTLEWTSSGTSNHYNCGLIHWYGGQGANFNNLNINDDGQVFAGSGFDPSQPHDFGMLHVPATDTTPGRIEGYLDGVKVKTYTYDKYVSGGTPNTSTDPAFSVADIQHWRVIAGTATANPMKVYSIKVWQKNDSGNITQ
jgi:hypothetical protein